MRRCTWLLFFCCAWAQAHDSWFEVETPAPRATEIRLRLGTGAQFPKLETSVGAGALVTHGCRDGANATVPLAIVRDTPQALHLRARIATPPRGGLSCWAQLVPFEIAGLKPEIITVYFDEIAAPAQVRATWAGLAARGLPWRERYVKHARIELFDATAATQPVAMGMDIVLEGPPPRVGETLVFRVLRDGAPLPDQAIELRSALSPLGLWLKTDAEGRARSKLPLAGRWLLRGTDLRISADEPERWDSRFVTLAFDVKR